MTSRGMPGAMRELDTLFHEGTAGVLSDGQLLDRFLERRDASAFEVIVERYGPLVWGVCRRVLRDHHDAEDAFQATFLVFARKAASVMPREKLGHWLYGVAFQTAWKARATRAKRRTRERQTLEAPEPLVVADEHADELLSQLDREVARLPEKYRRPIILCALEGKTHQQAAEQLGWPVGTVSGRLSRARAMLARRLSSPGTPLTIGALGVLLAHDQARAAVPSHLVRATAQAACLLSAGKAMTAGVVSADVVSLTGEVLKTMFIHKLTLTTAMALVVLALVTGGTSLAYRAHATEPVSPKQGAEKPKEPSHPEETALDLEQAPVSPRNDEPKPAETPKQEIPRSKDSERAPTEQAKPSTLLVGDYGDWPGTRQKRVERGNYLFTALRTGNAALAYNKSTRQVKAVRLNATKDESLWVTPVVIKSSDVEEPKDATNSLVALGVKGQRITRVAVFNLKSGKWVPLDLDQPVSGSVWPISFSPDTAAYEVGEFLYIYTADKDAWDRLDLSKIADDTKEPSTTRGR